MLRLLCCGLLLAAGHLHAQFETRTLEVAGAERLHVSTLFGDVELFPSTTGKLTFTHIVLVNEAERPELGRVTTDRDGDLLRLQEVGPTQDQLSRECQDRVTDNDGTRYTSCNSRIRLRIGVPAGMRIEVDTEYGGVRVADIAGLARVHSTYGTLDIAPGALDAGTQLDLYSNYGDVDLTLPADANARLELITEYGSLLTDFDIAIDEGASEQRQFYERVVGTIGSGAGARVKCRSPYDNVYLRQAR